MDHISFMRVTVEEAKAALRGDGASVRPSFQNLAKNQLEAKRAPQNAVIQDLAIDTFKWLAVLPKEVRPNALACKFPRIANRIAEIWKRPLQCERYLDDLVIDLRGARQGFPPDVAADIAKLKVYFLTHCHTAHFGVWGNRIGQD